MESLTRQFLECDESFTAISRKEKEAILDRLVKKTCNAQQGIIVKARSAESTK
jgi:ABC-type transport system involved in cytochrome c biogenesis ATPase subunit